MIASLVGRRRVRRAGKTAPKSYDYDRK